MDEVTLGTCLRFMRIALAMNQEELAAKSGVSQATISRTAT